MKSLKYVLTLVALIFSASLFSQSTTKTIKFKVDGVCGMCKERIESALDVKGVKYASWDKNTHICEVVFKTDKISEEKIHQLVAGVGHDTEKVKASSEAYNKVHGCCKYRENPESH